MKQLSFIIFLIMIFTCLQAQQQGNINQLNVYYQKGASGLLNYTTGDPHNYQFTTNNGQVVSFSSIQAFTGDNTIGIEEVITNENFKVYPNPTSQEIKIDVDIKKYANYRVQLYDINGKRILDELHQESSATINLKSLPNAAYQLYILKTDYTIINQVKIIKN